MKRIRKWLFGVLAPGVILLLGWLVLVLAKPPPPPPLPNPNGYEDFVKAGGLLVNTDSVLDDAIADNDTDQLRAIVSTNAESLRLCRVGLSRECRFPVELFLTNLSTGMQTLASIKGLARLLNATGHLAELEGRTNDAITCYVDAIKLGSESSRGGMLIHRLVGIACEAIGYKPLARLVPDLNLAQSRQLASELEDIESRQVAWDEVWRSETIYARREVRQNPNPLTFVPGLWGVWKAAKASETKDKRIRVALRLLTTELALRSYQLETGRAPVQLSELVPKYLKAISQDAFRNGPLFYRPQQTNWILYSVGQDRVDNHGKRKSGKMAQSGDDLFYESPW